MADTASRGGGQNGAGHRTWRGLGGPAGRAFAPPRFTGGRNGSFELVRRGYDPEQVDQRMQQLVEAAEDQVREAQTRVTELEQAKASADDSGFGSRVEKLLRLAEQEAAEVRERASSEANQYREQARADAEAHRHQVEEDLIARASKMDDEVARRTASLNQREQDIDEKLAAVKAEAERIRSGAEREAEAERTKAEQRARELTHQAERAAQRIREAAQEEVDRLVRVRDGVCAEMAELHRLLGVELESVPQPGPDAGALSEDAGAAGNASSSGQTVSAPAS